METFVAREYGALRSSKSSTREDLLQEKKQHGETRRVKRGQSTLLTSTYLVAHSQVGSLLIFDCERKNK